MTQNSLLSDISEILVDSTTLSARIGQLGTSITSFYNKLHAPEITIISITNGAIVFTADLFRQINIPVRLDCIRISSYEDQTSPTSAPRIIDTLKLDVFKRHVLIVDDILDTGHTLQRLVQLIEKLNPETLHTCVLLDKKGRRTVDIRADFVGFEIPNEFVVGYGLDFAERYRNLPFIGVLAKEKQVIKNE